MLVAQDFPIHIGPVNAPDSPRSDSQILRGRGIGGLVGTLIGAGWMAYGLSVLPNLVRLPLGLVGLGVVVFLFYRSCLTVAASRQLPDPGEAARATNRRVWRWFWINFLVEIVLLNVAINLLTAPWQRVYWTPAISLVVGLHFLPMARFFVAPAYWVCGGAMIVVAALTAWGVWAEPHVRMIIVGLEAVANAGILWATVARGFEISGQVAKP